MFRKLEGFRNLMFFCAFRIPVILSVYTDDAQHSYFKEPHCELLSVRGLCSVNFVKINQFLLLFLVGNLELKL
jgi:hypothetical protein